MTADEQITLQIVAPLRASAEERAAATAAAELIEEWLARLEPGAVLELVRLIREEMDSADAGGEGS